MGHSQKDKMETHERIVRLAAQRFRECGIDAISIANLMKEAGLTQGGFYKHFSSRDKLVTEAVTTALLQAQADPLSAQASRTGGAAFPSRVKAYLNPLHRDSAGEGCAVVALVNDMSRAGHEARDVYTRQVNRAIDTYANLIANDATGQGRDHAIVAFSAMVGALALARAVSDATLSNEILETVSTYLIDTFANDGPAADASSNEG